MHIAVGEHIGEGWIWLGGGKAIHRLTGEIAQGKPAELKITGKINEMPVRPSLDASRQSWYRWAKKVRAALQG